MRTFDLLLDCIGADSFFLVWDLVIRNGSSEVLWFTWGKTNYGFYLNCWLNLDLTGEVTVYFRGVVKAGSLYM